jgi:hypothetical protein
VLASFGVQTYDLFAGFSRWCMHYFLDLTKLNSITTITTIQLIGIRRKK